MRPALGMKVYVASIELAYPDRTAYIYTHRVLRSLGAAGVEGVALPYSLPGALSQHGGALGPFLGRRFSSYHKNDGPGLVHDTGMWGALRGVDVGTIYDLVPFEERGLFAYFVRDSIRSVVRRSRRIVAISDHTLGEIRERFGPRVADRTRVVPVPFEPVADDRMGAEFDVLWIGSNHPRKGLPLLLEALKGLPSLRSAVRWKPYQKAQGPNEAVASALARLPNAVSMTQMIDWKEVERLYRTSSCFVSTSSEEGFQMPVLEAYLRGTRVVVAADEGVPAGQYLKGEVGVHFYRPGDVQDLRRAILEATQAGPFTPSPRVRDMVSLERCGLAFRAIYEEVGRAHHPSPSVAGS